MQNALTMIEINGSSYRELRCKNDSCRKLIVYERVTKGIIAYTCPNCQTISEFRFNYGKGQEVIDNIIEDQSKGGET